MYVVRTSRCMTFIASRSLSRRNRSLVGSATFRLCHAAPSFRSYTAAPLVAAQRPFLDQISSTYLSLFHRFPHSHSHITVFHPDSTLCASSQAHAAAGVIPFCVDIVNILLRSNLFSHIVLTWFAQSHIGIGPLNTPRVKLFAMKY